MVKNWKKYPIVLTTDRTLMSEYNGIIFLGFSACVPKGIVPDSLYFKLFCPPIGVNDDGSVEVAHCGTRKIEASLVNYGFNENDIVVAHPEHLTKVIGPETKVIGITENDPLGIGPATTTFTGIFGGEAYMAIKFRELLNHPSIRRYRPKIIVGGPGAWELQDEKKRKDLGVDAVVVGEGEKVVGPLFERALKGESIPGIIQGDVAGEHEIPVIRKATIDGIIEIARGCGRGCDFCVPTLQRFRCVSIDHVLKEVGINLRAGRQPLLHAEDIIRYKAQGVEVNKEAVVGLFRNVKNYPGVTNVGISHFALASVASVPEVVQEISNILEADSTHWIGGQTGIETASPRLMDKHMKGKCKPFASDEWPQIVFESFQILAENNWLPCSTLILGLPGETDKDTDLTISLVEKLRPFKSLIIPLFFVAMGGLEDKSESLALNKMTAMQTELLMKCWKHNFVWVPTIYSEMADLCVSSRITRKGLGAIISYSSGQAKKLIDICEKEYAYDLPRMISDIKSGSLKITSLPLRLLKSFL